MDVKMPVTSNITAYLAVIKAREAPLDLKYPLPNQIQVISMTIDREEEAQQDEVNQSFFTRLHQFTRHYYAPLARSARQNTQVSPTIHIKQFSSDTVLYNNSTAH